MKILIVRHAIAVEREDFKRKDDDLRPLTADGKDEFKKLSKVYKKLYDVDLMLSSPLVRAIQTSDILKRTYKKSYALIDDLRPGKKPQDLLKKIKEFKKEFVLIVGHEPDLSQFVGYVITGKQESIVELKKGGACLLEVGARSKIIALHSPKSFLKLRKLN